MQSTPRIEALTVEAYRVPTDGPEADGTLDWNHTDVLVVHAHAGNAMGLGWSYAAAATGRFIEDTLGPSLRGASAFAVEGAWLRMHQHLRNVGVAGAGAMAISAVDVALWDLKAKLLDISLLDLLGSVRSETLVYGSGGFTNYDDARLSEQLADWVARGISRVKMKVGRDAADDARRVRVARSAIGDAPELYVDANGGYSQKQALAMAERFALESRVSWFEEPRPSADLRGLRMLRERAPAGLDVAAGEYGDSVGYFRRMLEAGAVDCLQADVTRAGGYTGFLKVAALCEAFALPLSAHCAPQLHAHVACAVAPLRHVESFYDHERIERLFFDGALAVENGYLRPDRGRCGHGLSLKRSDAERYRV